MNSLAIKTGNIPNDLVQHLTFHQNRYQSEAMPLPLNESISQKVAAAIAQGKEANYNIKMPVNSQLPQLNGNSNKKHRPEKPNSLPVLNCLFAALNKQSRQKDNEVSQLKSFILAGRISQKLTCNYAT